MVDAKTPNRSPARGGNQRGNQRGRGRNNNNRGNDRKFEREVVDVRETWKPKTEVGLKVKEGEVTDLSEVLDKGGVISEPEIVDVLFPNLETDLLLVGQAKGKFGGGQRRIFRQTQKKTKEGNAISFVCLCACGNQDGYVGIGTGKSKETVPAKEKAIRQAKLNMIKVRRGKETWGSVSESFHTIPYTVTGKCGSVTVKLMPAPKGKGLVINSECAKVLRLAGIEDVWSKVYGPTKSRLNVIRACFDALKKLTQIKVREQDAEKFADGKIEG